MNGPSRTAEGGGVGAGSGDEIPSDGRVDATLVLLSDPYRYVSRRAGELGSDLFQTRLLLQRTLCMTGREAARLFYTPGRFVRRGAAPRALRRSLFGEGGVQGLDGPDHAHRKALLLEVAGPERAERLAEESLVEWRRLARRTASTGRMPLYPAAQEILTRAVCRWAGLSLEEGQVERWRRELVALFDAAGSPTRHVHARRARARCEQWAADRVQAVRQGSLSADAGTALHRIAAHRDRHGELLPPRIAAVELLNVLRPTVAVAAYFVHVVHALEHHPGCRESLRSAPTREVEHFVHEVRRAYPFFPAVPARVREDFEWRGLRLRAGTRTLLDLYGINHDPRIWEEPQLFRPERFRSHPEDPFSPIPQGGGEPGAGHRCAGEGVAIALMRSAVRFLVDELEYRIPGPCAELDFARLPALPRHPIVLEEVRLRRAACG